MRKFKSHINHTSKTLFEERIELLEKLITFGGKAYPKFGNVIIMAGGAGSGKGFIKNNLVGAEGFNFDVDEMKRLVGKAPRIIKKVKDELGIDLKELSANLRNPENVLKLHSIVGDTLNIKDKRLNALYQSILLANEDRKPNLIFDVTLKDLNKLQDLTYRASQLGYDKKNIHIVWVINDIEVAKRQNEKRSRVVAAEILINTHRGVSATMNDVLSMGKKLNQYMDGDIVFAFNKVNVDTELVTKDASAPTERQKKAGMFTGKGTASFVKDAEYFYVKRAGKPVIPIDKLSKSIRRKISNYVPPEVKWI